MIEALNHVLETQKQLRVPAKAPDSGAQARPFERPPAQAGGTETAQAESKAEPKEFNLFGKDGFDFFDVLDVINPLQHIPVISTIYRRLTGDELSPVARIAGATLFGGPIGAALAMADSAVEYNTGKDTGANIYAALFGNEGPIPAAGTAVAAAAPWQDPDLIPLPQSVAMAGGDGGRSSAFIAPAAPDLGALSTFTTAAGTAPAKLEPKFAIEPWQAPQPIPAAAVDVPPAAPVDRIAPTAITVSAPVPPSAPVAAEHQMATPAAKGAERPMPSDAAKAQAINALAAMPTSQTTAAVAELASNEPRSAATRRHMTPPAGDIPRGASSSLSRKATGAYQASMMTAKADVTADVRAANTNSATALGELERSTSDAQNDWMLDAMQRAMAKYEATAKLRTAANDQGAGVAVSR